MTAAGAACRCREEEATKAITHTHPALRSSPRPYRRREGEGGQAQAHSHSHSPISLTFLNSLSPHSPTSPLYTHPSVVQTLSRLAVRIPSQVQAHNEACERVPLTRSTSNCRLQLLSLLIDHIKATCHPSSPPQSVISHSRPPQGPGRILPLRGCDRLVFFLPSPLPSGCPRFAPQIKSSAQSSWPRTSPLRSPLHNGVDPVS
ncbi:uncharacterized protein CCOS01_02459 [Colletotrichum costaricense]|uniref:Uncharacterized protein n=1 Tax=Colletotrichum costaricense TaxID=1209916 RepID=A0AAI9Z829_9PEZI|nr:uncharacterized protein CCOS01_02459 [Colletotrichum costaricense]KAK1537139.1 hypothetical protein CCOS01_02459 [Colletotrichum costaricense]